MISNYFPKKRNLLIIGVCWTFLIANGCLKSNESVDATADSTQLSAQKTENKSKKVEKTSKNLILFVGDGMGMSTITAGRIFDGQSKGLSGEEHQLAFESFDNVALIKTYNYDAQVPDSAGTATAMMGGYLARKGTLNVKPDDLLGGCGDRPAPATLSERAAKAGLSVGIVTNTRITHATPAAVFAHSAHRDWESDKDIKGQAKEIGCRSIAAQLVDSATPVNLAIGGGRKEFSKAQREQWAARSDSHLYIKKEADFAALDPNNSQDVLALLSKSHMAFEADRTTEPSLSEMTEFAIKNLASRETGYVLLVEAGRIDHAHHAGNAYRALRDVQALNQAVESALELTGDDTTIMVTADHSHVFTIAGYPKRGNPILGLVEEPQAIEDQLKGEEYVGQAKLASDGKPYTTLGYQNGSGPQRSKDSPALTHNHVQSKDFRQEVTVPLPSESHSGEDVALYATGPGAENVRGVMHQSKIAAIIDAALGLE